MVVMLSSVSSTICQSNFDSIFQLGVCNYPGRNLNSFWTRPFNPSYIRGKSFRIKTFCFADSFVQFNKITCRLRRHILINKQVLDTHMMSNGNQTASPRLGPSSNKSKIFNSADHANNISKKLQTFYEKNQFFDAFLITGANNVKLEAHRIVLSASSDYFLGMFCSTLQDAEADEIKLNEIDANTMKLIIKFMYTASIELHNDNVESVLIAADFLQMNTLISACCDFMGEQLDASNCLGIARFAEQHSFEALYKKASSFAFTHFDKVWTEEEFVQLSEEQLNKFLSSEDIIAPSEEIVFRSLVAWVAYDKENREKLIINLLSHVRFTLLKPKFIIENRHLVCKTIDCYELICSWLQWHLSPESRSPTEQTRTRKTNRKLAFATGIQSDDLKVQTLNPASSTWSYEEFSIPTKQRTDYSVTVIDKKMIVAGGKINEISTNSVEYLDLETNEWRSLPPMGLARNHPAIAELSGDLYIVGGLNNGSWSRSVEKYDFSTQKWQNVAPLNSSFERIQVAFHEGFLCAVGNNSYAMECYEVSENKWTMKAIKNNKCLRFGIAVVGGYLYAVGGDNNGTRCKTVERYHPSKDMWTVVCPLKTGRSSVRCVALNGRLIACGGFDGQNWIGSIEQYDAENDEWSNLISLLPHELNYYANTNSIFTM